MSCHPGGDHYWEEKISHGLLANLKPRRTNHYCGVTLIVVLRKAGDAPRHKPILVVFACAFVFVFIAVVVVVVVVVVGLLNSLTTILSPINDEEGSKPDKEVMLCFLTLPVT